MGAEGREYGGDYGYFELGSCGLTVPLQLITEPSAPEDNAETLAKYEFEDACLTIYKPKLNYGMLYSCIICSVLFHTKETICLGLSPQKLCSALAKQYS